MSSSGSRPASKIFFPKVAAPLPPGVSSSSSVDAQAPSGEAGSADAPDTVAATSVNAAPPPPSSSSASGRPASGEMTPTLKHSPSSSSLTSSQNDDVEESEAEREDEEDEDIVTEGEDDEPEQTPSPTPSGVLSPLAAIEDKATVAIRCTKCGREGHWAEDCTLGAEEHVTVDVVYVTHRGKMMIKSATLERLVEGLYTESKGTQEFITEYADIFLLTFRTFTNAKDVFSMIVKTYQECAKEHDTETKAKRLRIGNVLKRWVENHFYDFELDDDLLLSYKRFLDHMQGMGVDQPMISALRKAIDKGRERIGTVARRPSSTNLARANMGPTLSQSGGLQVPAPILPKKGAKCKPFDWDPVEFARQITIAEFDLYKAIPPQEFLCQKTWKLQEMMNTAPTLLRLIQRFNHLSMWVSCQIVKEANLKKRASLVAKCIRIAKECLVLHNFHAVFEFVSGLSRASVSRLKKTWAVLKKDKDVMALWDELNMIVKSDGSFAAYRTRLHTINPPAIPYVGVYQSDLTFIEEGNPDKCEDNRHINFFKRRLAADVIKEIQTYQHAPYMLHYVEAFHKQFEEHDMANLDDNTIYDVSLIIEPREKKKTPAPSSTPSSPVTKTPSTSAVTVGSDRKPTRSNTGLAAVQQAGTPQGSPRASNKLNKFFGEDSVDFSFYQKYNKSSEAVGADILKDVDLKVTRTVSESAVASPQLRQSSPAVVQKPTPTPPLEKLKQVDEQPGWV